MELVGLHDKVFVFQFTHAPPALKADDVGYLLWREGFLWPCFQELQYLPVLLGEAAFNGLACDVAGVRVFGAGSHFAIS